MLSRNQDFQAGSQNGVCPETQKVSAPRQFISKSYFLIFSNLGLDTGNNLNIQAAYILYR